MEEKKWQYACRLFEMNSLEEGGMWPYRPVARQQLHEMTRNVAL
jgi:hypothetical protein